MDLITSHSFSFYNAGGMPLKVTKVESGCACVATLVGKEELKPGERSEIVAKFNTREEEEMTFIGFMFIAMMWRIRK